MKDRIKLKLAEAWKYCDENDKSTEFMLQYMQDTAGVSLDTVIQFLEMYASWTDIISPGDDKG